MNTSISKNKMNINELEGRELDAKVHNDVMDLHGAYRYEGAFGHEQTRRVSEDCPYYSTDIAAAWLVVDKLVEIGFYVDIGVDKHGAQVQLDKLGPKDISWLFGESIRGKDVPEAICHAAEKAMEEQNE